MKTAVAILLLATTRLPAGGDAREIVRRAIEADGGNQAIARNYAYVERSARRTLSGDGSVKHTEIRTRDVSFSDGAPYARLIEIDDKPLPPDQERREKEKLRNSLEERRKESPEERAKRVAEWKKQSEKDRKFLDEVVDAMDFRMAGEEQLGGRPAWVIEAASHPGYRPRSSEGRSLSKFRGKLWIDKEDGQVARLDAEATDDVSFGIFLAKMNKGSRFLMESARVNGEVWLPKRVAVRFSGRLLMSRIAEEQEMSFKNYRKFQAESRLAPETNPK